MDKILRNLNAGELSSGEAVRQLFESEMQHGAGEYDSKQSIRDSGNNPYSITRGTRYKPASTYGATA